MKNKKILACVALLSLTCFGNAHAAPTRKQVTGKVMLCSGAPVKGDSLCRNPVALNHAVLEVRPEGQSLSGLVYTNGRGTYNILMVPGRYRITMGADYEEYYQAAFGSSCRIFSFPEELPTKTLVVGPTNKKKDLYFYADCGK